MKILNAKEFINEFYIQEIGSIIYNHPYLSFIQMGIGIEFLGKCLDVNTNDWNERRKSKTNFENAIRTIPSLKKYERFLTTHKLYESYRCGLAHASVPSSHITLSSKNEKGHLIEVGNKLNLKVEDFYQDFQEACEFIISEPFDQNNKVNMPFICLPGQEFNFGTNIETGYASSAQTSSDIFVESNSSISDCITND